MEIDKELIKQIKITPLIETLKLEEVSDAEYFSQKYSRNYISNSRLGVLKRDGVKAFFEGIPQVFNPSFITGTLIHQQVLEPESFYVVDSVFKPTAKAGLMADALYKGDGTTPTDDEIKSQSYIVGYYKDKLTPSRIGEFRQKAESYWRDRYLYEQKTQLPTDKEIIYTDEKNFEILSNCLKSLNSDNNIQSLLHPSGLIEEPISMNEHTILMDIQMEIPGYEPRVYKLKAKVDNFTINKEEELLTVNDLKTCGKPVDMFDPLQYSYQREIAYYSWLLKLCSKKFYNLKNPKIKGNFLVVSTVPEYKTKVYPMTPKLFKNGIEEYKYLLRCVYIFNTIYGYEFK